MLSRVFRFPIIFLLLFLICFGIGYPGVGRFDPRTVDPDSVDYYKLVAGRPSDASDLLRYRVLVPWVAKPFARISRGHIGHWDPIAFGLLISNSLFTAGTGVLLLLMGSDLLGFPVAFTGTLLYLANFTVHNRQLGLGLVESGEAFFVMLLFFVLFRRKFYLLPIIGVLGGLAKESVIPMCTLIAAGWLLFEYREGRRVWKPAAWSATMIVIGLATIVALQASIIGHIVWPWQFAATIRQRDVSLFRGLIGCFRDRYFTYTFIWLLPLGVIRLREFPKPWIWASGAGAIAALAMGAWNNAAGNTVPSIFNCVGPILSLSTAMLLVGAPNREGISREPYGQFAASRQAVAVGNMDSQ